MKDEEVEKAYQQDKCRNLEGTYDFAVQEPNRIDHRAGFYRGYIAQAEKHQAELISDGKELGLSYEIILLFSKKLNLSFTEMLWAELVEEIVSAIAKYKGGE